MLAVRVRARVLGLGFGAGMWGWVGVSCAGFGAGPAEWKPVAPCASVVVCKKLTESNIDSKKLTESNQKEQHKHTQTLTPAETMRNMNSIGASCRAATNNCSLRHLAQRLRTAPRTAPASLLSI